MAFSETSAFSMQRSYTAEISTYNLQAGFQYIQPISKKDKIVLGATYTLGHNFDNDAIRNTQTINGTTVETQTSDTIKHAFQWPSSIAAGITYYHSNNFRIGADFELQQWSKCRFPNQETGFTGSAISETYTSTKGQLNDRTKIAAGLDWIPNPASTKYFNRCTYKVGGYYSKTYAKADLTGVVTDKPYEFGVSAGVSLPIANAHVVYISQSQRTVPHINLSVQWVHTNIPYLNASTLRQSTLTENYLKLCIGVTFSERWFYKLRFK